MRTLVAKNRALPLWVFNFWSLLDLVLRLDRRVVGQDTFEPKVDTYLAMRALPIDNHCELLSHLESQLLIFFQRLEFSSKSFGLLRLG